MKSTTLKFHPHTGEVRAHTIPFVCLNEPFVCGYKPRVIPFIDKNYPFICNYRISGGFTLMELIIAIVIVGILAAIAAPAMRAFVQNQRITSQTNGLLAELNFARSEAIKRGANIGVCSSMTDCSAPSANWENGWSTFVDSDNGSDWDAGEQILRVHQRLDGNNTLRVTTPAGSSAPFFFTANGAAAARTYSLCDSRGTAFGRNIFINTVGQVRVALGASACP